LPQLKQLLRTEADITVFRELKELSYRTGYSHRGSFYTLDEMVTFDEQGLWSFDSVWFSRHGTLVATAEDCATQSRAGCFASELEDVLHVPVKEPLLQLVAQGRIARACSARSAGTGPPSRSTVTKRPSSSYAPPQPLPD